MTRCVEDKGLQPLVLHLRGGKYQYESRGVP